MLSSLQLSFIVALGLPIQAHSRDFMPSEDSCRKFTQDFYDWYLPNAHFEPSLEQALKQRHSSFEPGLAQRLDEGSTQAKRSGEPFLDFDPILNSQDPAYPYKVKKVSLTKDRCLADIYGVGTEEKPKKADVIVESVYKDGHWLFVDFRYPNSESPENKSLSRILDFLNKQK